MIKLFFKNIAILSAIVFAFGCCTAMADDVTPRTKKDIQKLIKGVDTTDSFDFSVVNNPAIGKITKWDFVSLKSVPSESLNEIEMQLVTLFDDVAICHHKGDIIFAYWVKDADGKIGLIGFDGNVLVPPVDGKTHFIYGGANKFSMSPKVSPRRMLAVGDVEFDNQEKWCNALSDHYNKTDGLGLGHFCAVIDRPDFPDISILIPYGAYVDVMLTYKNLHRPDFFVADLGDDGELKWGVLNWKGDEDVPCEYRAIYKKSLSENRIDNGGSWETTNEKTMDQMHKFRSSRIASQKQLAAERAANWAEIFQAVGDVSMSAAQTIETVNLIKATAQGGTVGGDGGSGDWMPTQYKKWEKRAKEAYESLTLTGTKVKNKKGEEVGGTNGQSLNTGNYVLQKKCLREAQNNMKDIRQKANKKGIKIEKSHFEDVVVTY